MHNLHGLASKLDVYGKALTRWFVDGVGGLQTNIALKEKELASRLEDLSPYRNLEEVSRYKDRLSELYRQDEIFEGNVRRICG